MSEQKCGPAGGWSSWTTVLVFLAAQALLFAVWVGSIQTTVAGHTAWIEERKRVNLDSRLAVLESENTTLRSEMALHIQNDRDRALPIK